MQIMYRLTLSVVVAFACVAVPAHTQTFADTALTALKTIDPEILQYFPRWRVCEPDLQVQIKQSFALMGYTKANLDDKSIVVTAAPVKEGEQGQDFELILIECGSERMVASEISSNMKRLAMRLADGKRPYCYNEIPPSAPPSAPQIAEIISYMEPTNVTHSFTLSAFEQSLKIGTSGFWLKASLGTDQVGYTFWSSGEGRVFLQRPLYENSDPDTRKPIPYLINARLGFGYRMTGNLDGQSRLLDFIPGRKLNGSAGGKIVGGLDFHMPFHPQFGLGLNVELPLQSIDPTNTIDVTSYYIFDIGSRRVTAPSYDVDPYATTAVMRSTGQATLFYNLWLNRKIPENFFRFDVGISYAEVQEAAVFLDTLDGKNEQFLGRDGVNGLVTWKPNEALDWIYAKVEYRNQAAFPFGISLQYSNQILLARAYIPVFGDWFYLEGRYSTPLRDARPFEVENFFMFSPVLRLNF
ncbi:MAG TPA: hypothetical protein VK147_09270 [Candidatus Didemnitutus sp.]|nr:hypothetical protein [Candidatus Didemnitutus sp.]